MEAGGVARTSVDVLIRVPRREAGHAPLGSSPPDRLSALSFYSFFPTLPFPHFPTRLRFERGTSGLHLVYKRSISSPWVPIRHDFFSFDR